MCVKNLPMIAIWTRTAGNRTHDLQLASSMPPGCTIWLRGHYKWLSYYADRLHWRSVALTKYKLSPNLDFHPHNSFSLETLKRPHFVVAVDITSKRSLAAAILFYCTRYQYLPIRIPRFPLSVHYSHYPYPQLLRSLTPGLTPIFSKKKCRHMDTVSPQDRQHHGLLFYRFFWAYLSLFFSFVFRWSA